MPEYISGVTCYALTIIKGGQKADIQLILQLYFLSVLCCSFAFCSAGISLEGVVGYARAGSSPAFGTINKIN